MSVILSVRSWHFFMFDKISQYFLKSCQCVSLQTPQFHFLSDRREATEDFLKKTSLAAVSCADMFTYIFFGGDIKFSTLVNFRF